MLGHFWQHNPRLDIIIERYIFIQSHKRTNTHITDPQIDRLHIWSHTNGYTIFATVRNFHTVANSIGEFIRIPQTDTHFCYRCHRCPKTHTLTLFSSCKKYIEDLCSPRCIFISQESIIFSRFCCSRSACGTHTHTKLTIRTDTVYEPSNNKKLKKDAWEEKCYST